MLVPHKAAQFGVISDIDDTVVQTDVTRWLRVLGAVLFGNAHTRLPFRGVAAFYRALEAGVSADGAQRLNPLFYVSSSPWNLYDLLLEFLTLSNIPLGPLNLRAWRGGTSELLPSGHGAFKQAEIRRILDTFPDLPFILIGDSGEEDPEIYGEIVSAYPGRILAVYIRNVSGEQHGSTVARFGAGGEQDHTQLISWTIPWPRRSTPFPRAGSPSVRSRMCAHKRSTTPPFGQRFYRRGGYRRDGRRAQCAPQACLAL